MQKRISYYDVDWKRREAKGAIHLSFDDRSQLDLAELSLEEVSLLANLLRGEKPVFYDAERERFSTRADSVGE